MRTHTTLIIPLIALAVAACNGEDTDVPVETATLELVVSDFGGGATIPGLQIDHAGGSATTDDTGRVSVSLPQGTSTWLTATRQSYLDSYWGFAMGAADEGLGTFLVSETTADQTMAALGVTRDAAKGIVVAVAFDSEGRAVPGVTFDLDVAYDAVLVADSGSPFGFSVGNTTVAGSSPWVVFLNVDAGAFVATPSSDCAGWPGGSSDFDATSYASGITHVHYVCE